MTLQELWESDSIKKYDHIEMESAAILRFNKNTAICRVEITYTDDKGNVWTGTRNVRVRLSIKK